MEGFNEQVVKRVNKAKQLLIKIFAVVILISIPFIGAAIAIATHIQYIFVVSIFLFLGGIYGVWYVFTSQKVEFEYSVAGNDLDVCKIIALRKRRLVCRVPINEITELTKDEKAIDAMRFTKTFIAARDVDAKDENYYAVFSSPAFGKCLLVFTPNQNILEGLKPHLNKTLVIKLFYQNNER